MEISLLFDIALVIIVAAVSAILIRLVRQPLIFGYVLAGIVIGPATLGLIKNPALISTLSEIGIAFLLFIIGIELDIKKLKTIGPSIIIIGIIQVLATFLVGLAAGLLLKFSAIESIYIGLILAFSSTMIVIKLLSDKNELDSIHGRIILGVLVVQDVLAVLALSLLGSSSGTFSIANFGIIIAKGTLLFGIIYVATKYLLPLVLKFVVESTELLFVGALTICFVFAGLAYYLGYSLSIGAFVAGLALGSTPFNFEIASRIKPLRDFFAIIFFVALGMSIILSGMAKLILPLIIFFLIVIVIKPIITFYAVKWFKYSNRTSFFTGTALAQVSEFSLILAAQALSLKQISEGTFTITTLITIITMILTAYIIKFDDSMYGWFSRWMKRDEIHGKDEIGKLPKKLRNHIVVFGTHRMGMKIIKTLVELKKNFVVADINPERVRTLLKKKINCVYGDMANSELYEMLHLRDASVVISSVNQFDNNLKMINAVRKENRKVIVIVATRSYTEAIRLYKAGADYVVLPETLGGEKVSNYMIHLTSTGIREWGRKHYKSIVQEEKEKLVEI